MNILKSFILILQFMTRIPVNLSLDIKREDFAKGIRFFPIVGFIVGGFSYLAVTVSAKLFSLTLAAILGVLAHVTITGGLHLDGLGDSADGMLSGRSKERILEIMKDSRSGTFGVLALILILLLRFGAIGDILDKAILKVIIIAPVISRAAVTLLMYKRRYAREHQGLGDLFIGQISLNTVIIAWLSGVVITLLLTFNIVSTSIIAITSLLCAFIFRTYVEKKIEGITGDILGAFVELNEVTVMLLCIALKSCGVYI